MSRHKTVEIGGKKYQLHRLIWELAHGPIPMGHVIHHVDHDKGNNDLSNLECMTHAAHSRLHREHDGLYPKVKVAEPTAFKCSHCGIDSINIKTNASLRSGRRYCGHTCREQAAYHRRRAA
jgi:hypothetical protein